MSDLYRNNLKNREFGKEDPQNLHSERATIAERQGASENTNSETNPTPPKTDSSGCFGIYLNKSHKRAKTPLAVESKEIQTSRKLFSSTSLLFGY